MKREFSIIEKALDLHKMKKKNPGFFKTPAPKRPVGRPMKQETVLKGFRAIKKKLNAPVAPEQLQLLSRQLTGGGQGMKLKEFRYYPYPGNPYGNPEDFAKEREKERRGGMIKAGLIGAGLLGGGALVGRGLFKAGISTAARRADDLERELVKLRSAKPAAAPDVPAPAPAPRGRPRSETPPPPPPPSNADKAILAAGKKSKSAAPKVEVVENLQKSGAISNADGAAEVAEALAAKTRKLTPRQQELKKRAEKVARRAAANSTPATPATVAAPAPATKAPPAPKEAPAPKASEPEFWEQPGVGKVPLTGSAQSNAALRQELDKLHGAGGFKGKVAADVIEDARKRVAEAENLSSNSQRLREIAKAQGKKPATRSAAQPASVKAGRKPANISSSERSKLADDFEKEMGQSGKSTPAKKSKAAAADVLTPQQRREIQASRRVKKARRIAKSAAKAKSAKRAKKLAAILRGVREFNYQTDEGGIPFTGKVAKDRFIKKLRDEDLDRRDANILRAGATGALAGLLFRGRLSRGKRALIGAGLGGASVIGTRMATDRTRDIYGERSRGAKRAEALPALAGLGAAGWLATRRIRGLAARLRGVKEFARGKYAIPALGKMLKDQSFLEEFMTGHRGPKLGDLNIVRDMKTKLAGNPKLARVLAKKNIDLGPGRLTQKNTDARNWAADALRRGKKGGAILTPENHLRVGPVVGGKLRVGFNPLNPSQKIAIPVGGRRGPESYIVWPPRNLETTDLAARLRGVKEFGSMGLGKLYRKKAALLKRGLFIEKLNPSTGKVLYREQRPLISDREKYAGIYRRLANKGPKGPNLPPWKQDVPVGGKLQSPYDGKMQQELKYDEVMRRHEKKVRGFAARLRGLKELDDYKLYYFRGRNTGIAARSAEEARKKKKRGGDELVAVRTPNATEKSQMARGIWVRTRRDGKSPGQSRYGKGRGQGPARKSMAAKIRGVKEFDLPFFQNIYTGESLQRKIFRSPAFELIKSEFAERDRITKAWENSKKRPDSATLRAAKKLPLDYPQRKAAERGLISRQEIADLLRVATGRGPTKGVLRIPRSVKLFSARLRSVKFFEKKKEKKSGGLNPYVGAALSGGASGALLGGLSILRRGVKPMAALGTAAKLGGISAGIVGGGALLGSRIVGKPREDEGAPFTKRAGIGGAIAGAGVGAAGALALRKTRGGARLLVSASKNWHPALWVRKSPLAAGIAVGGVAGGAYGLAQGLDEGQQVDSIRNLRKDIKAMSRRLRLVKFFGTREQARWDGGEGDSSFANTAWGWASDRPMYVPKRDDTGRILRDADGRAERVKWDPSSGQLWNAVAREAQKQRVTVQRGSRLTRDLVDEMRGAERRRDASGRIKKREWEKSWFQNKAAEIGMAAAGIGGLAAVRYANNNPDTKMGRAWINAQKSANATRKNARDIGQSIFKTITNITAKKALAAKLGRLKELDAMAEYYGWDVRDPRGRSARVFAPGSRRRERRPKEWHEKTENERKLWKAGLVASALGGAGALLVGQRLVSGKSLIPSRFVPKQPNPEVFVDAAKMFRPGAA